MIVVPRTRRVVWHAFCRRVAQSIQRWWARRSTAARCVAQCFERLQLDTMVLNEAGDAISTYYLFSSNMQLRRGPPLCMLVKPTPSRSMASKADHNDECLSIKPARYRASRPHWLSRSLNHHSQPQAALWTEAGQKVLMQPPTSGQGQ